MSAETGPVDVKVRTVKGRIKTEKKSTRKVLTY